jgi:hypothetical protein
VATWRANAADVLQGVRGGGRNIQRLDAWINSDGGPALSEEECALYGIPGFGSAFPRACPRYRDVGGTYSYTLNVGPRAGRLVVNPIVVHSESTVAVPVTTTTNPKAGTVTVSFTLPHNLDNIGVPVLQRFGITVEAGWSGAPVAVHHVVTLDSIHINATLDGPTEPNLNPISGPLPQQLKDVAHEQTPNPGEWVMYAQVNGHWWQIPPSLISQVQLPIDPSTGKTMPLVLPLNYTFDYWLPVGVSPTLYVSGRECDIPFIDCRNEHFGAPPWNSSVPPFNEAGYNDHPGRIEFGNTGLIMFPGQYTYAPAVNQSRDSTSEDLSDAACSNGTPDPPSVPCYRLTATAN